MVLAEKNDVRLVEEKDERGQPVYAVIFRNETRCKTGDKSAALEDFNVLQPIKAVCDKCKAMDVVVFFGRLGVGRLQVAGEGGWRMERFSGGLCDHRDVALCPECALALDGEINAYLARKKKR
jgi:hypothetical protein